MIDVGNIVALVRLQAIMVDHGEELVLPLLERVPGLGVVGQDLSPDDEIDGERDLLHDLLAILSRAIKKKALKVQDEDGRELLEAEGAAGLHQSPALGAAEVVQLLARKGLSQGILDAVDGHGLDVELEGQEGLELGGGGGVAVELSHTAAH